MKKYTPHRLSNLCDPPLLSESIYFMEFWPLPNQLQISYSLLVPTCWAQNYR